MTAGVDEMTSWSAPASPLPLNEGPAPDWLVCPDCRSALEFRDEASRCASCDKSWPHSSNLPCFTEGDYYWGEISREQMRDLLDLLEDEGWDPVTCALRSKYPSEYHLIFDASRAAWMFHLDPPAWDLALDVGAGYGGIARWLGSSFKEVVALEANVERTVFASHLYHNTGATNVRPLLANMHSSPLRHSSFDLIALTGVLEWAAMFGETIDARAAQLELLQKCRDLLKPGGIVYVAIENRFAPMFLLGHRDHDRFPWAGMLPYHLSKWLVRRFQGMDRQPSTHTRRGLQALMKRAGYGDVKFVLPIPGYHRPMVIAEPDDSRGPPWLLARLSTPSPVSDIGPWAVACWRLLQRFSGIWPLIRPVVPAYMVMARKEAP